METNPEGTRIYVIETRDGLTFPPPMRESDARTVASDPATVLISEVKEDGALVPVKGGD